MPEEVSTADRAFALKIVQFLYPNHRAEIMSPELVEFAHRMLEKMYEASDALHLVPRPTGTPPGFFYLFTQASQMLWRTKVSKSKKIYYITSTVLKWANRSEYEMLCMGI